MDYCVSKYTFSIDPLLVLRALRANKKLNLDLSFQCFKENALSRQLSIFIDNSLSGLFICVRPERLKIIKETFVSLLSVNVILNYIVPFARFHRGRKKNGCYCF